MLNTLKRLLINIKFVQPTVGAYPQPCFRIFKNRMNLIITYTVWICLLVAKIIKVLLFIIILLSTSNI